MARIASDASQSQRMTDRFRVATMSRSSKAVSVNRERALPIAFESLRSLGRELVFTHGFDLGRDWGIGL